MRPNSPPPTAIGSPGDNGASITMKRRRTSSNAQVHEATAPQRRLILLKIEDTDVTARGKYGSETRTKRAVSFFVPQYVKKQVPRFKSRLESALSEANARDAPTVNDEDYIKRGYTASTLQRTIDYLGGAPLPSLNTDEASLNLGVLLQVYDACQFLDIKTLEDDILHHIKGCANLSLEVFIEFARMVYGDSGGQRRPRDSPIGKLIHYKLMAFKPRLIQEGLSSKIAELGGTLGVVFYEISTSNSTADVVIKTEKNENGFKERVCDKSQLEEQLACPKGDEEPVICDKTAREAQVVAKAVRFLSSGYLYPLEASSSTINDDLNDLVKLYNFSTSLSIKRLEVGILDHIKNFRGFSLAIFLIFARSYYDNHGKEAQDTSLGHLIKQKLAEFLPRMVELKTVDEIKREGGILGQQLIEVLLDERAASQAKERTANDPAIKIEIEDDD